jgi:hypothetical protein
LGGAAGLAGQAVNLNGFTLITNNGMSLPLATLTLTALTPTFNVGGGMTLPLAVLTLTALIPASMGVVTKGIVSGVRGMLQKPPFNENTDDTMWNWFLKVWKWATGESKPEVTKTASFTASDAYFYPVDATAGSVVVTLPPASTTMGKKYVIKKVDSTANTVVITADTGLPDLIDGVASKTISTQYGTVFIESDGISAWWLLGASALATTNTGTVTSIATTAPITGGTITTTGTIGVTDFVASGASHARGTVPDPGVTSGITKFLREDSTWAVPASGGSVSQFIVVTATGAGTTAAAPTGTNAMELIMQAAGGGVGSSVAAQARGGAGSGEFMRRTIPVTAGNTYNYSVGTAGTNAGTDGGNTTFTGDTTVWTTLGGKGATSTTGGNGGGRLGGTGGAAGSPGVAGGAGVVEGVDAISGAGAGGAGTNSLNQPGGAGGPCEENAGGTAGSGSATPLPGGGGGGSTRFGKGGTGGNASNPGNAPAATSYGAGAGGPGAGTQVGAAGANGVLMYRWV